jgi:hypothetical protein
MTSGVVDPETLYTKQNCIGTPSLTSHVLSTKLKI